MAPPKGKQPAPSKKTETKKKEKVIEVSQDLLHCHTQAVSNGSFFDQYC